MSLPPVHPPIGQPHFINPHKPTRLILKEKAMSVTGDSLVVKLDPGNGQQPKPIFEAQSDWTESRKAFSDPEEEHLFSLEKEHLQFSNEDMKLVDYKDSTICEIKQDYKDSLRSRYTITFSSSGAADQVLIMEGNWRDSTAQIKHEGSGQVCAEVHRKSAFKSLNAFSYDEQSYMVTIAPGVDYSALAASCIAFDEWEK